MLCTGVCCAGSVSVAEKEPRRLRVLAERHNKSQQQTGRGLFCVPEGLVSGFSVTVTDFSMFILLNML